MSTYETSVRAPLRRSREGRVLGGVAAGLARHLDIDPLILRIGFVVVPLAAVPYLLAWILLPSDDGRDAGKVRDGVAIAAGTGLALLGGLLAMDQANPGWLDVDGRWIPPVLLGVTGLALIARGARD
jgi:phage shock protein PspC (stress-responsive transcriptional regulator)